MPTNLQCLRCGHSMEPGFLLELADRNARRVQEWIAGLPEKSVWTGLKVADRPRFNVVTFRCASCGYLESCAVSPESSAS